MSDKPVDWSSFTRRIYIEASVSAVYDAWAIPAQLATWFLEQADYKDPQDKPRDPHAHIRKGDSFEWKWNNWDAIEKGEVLEANGKDHIAFTFGKAGIVQVHIEKRNDRTHLKVIQEKIPTDERSRMSYHEGCALGWSFWVVNLKAWLEEGLLLHEQEPIDDAGTHEIVNM